MVRFIHDNFLTLLEPDLVEWLCTIAKQEGHTIEELEFNFVDPDKLLTLNKEFLCHDTDTDIITFDYTKKKSINAEAYISCSALLQNAKLHSQTPERECLRLLVHALLHCLGYNDNSIDQREIMRSKEEESINLFHVKH